MHFTGHANDYILKFDLESQRLALIEAPRTINDARLCFDMREIIQVVDGIVVLAILSHYYHNIQMWRREVNCQGVAKWVLWKTIDMHNIHGIPPGVEDLLCRLRYAEDTDDIFLHVGTSVYVVQLKLMQSKKLFEAHYVNRYYSFKSFYMPGDFSPLVPIP
uniref:Uncharacterized protein n=1 Tax=Triticum aestivum TaxID=4565 RepID=A0A077S814_WHEAT|nr:unnamed protein product [Triticum aestivum]